MFRQQHERESCARSVNVNRQWLGFDPVALASLRLVLRGEKTGLEFGQTLIHFWITLTLCAQCPKKLDVNLPRTHPEAASSEAMPKKKSKASKPKKSSQRQESNTNEDVTTAPPSPPSEVLFAATLTVS